MKKTRPCLVISPNEMNLYLQTIVIAPITSKSKSYPTRVEIITKNVSGWIVLDQIRSIDKIRVVSNLDKLQPDIIKKVKMIIRDAYVE
jgi:mRNA interferase MazF